jgi:hypothetical protein
MLTELTTHSVINGNACFAYFNKIWGIPVLTLVLRFQSTVDGVTQHRESNSLYGRRIRSRAGKRTTR